GLKMTGNWYYISISRFVLSMSWSLRRLIILLSAGILHAGLTLSYLNYLDTVSNLSRNVYI
ncbi:MAG: hypothetical protein ACTSPQ_21210, partial [Candidatus Helarchaeota archaeon]